MPLRSTTLPITIALCCGTVAWHSATAGTLLEPVQLAQLSKWLHGDAPPKAAPPKVLATVSTAAGTQADAEIEAFLREYALAIKARDGRSLLPRLSAQYRIDDLPSSSNASEVFLQAIERLPGAETIVVQAVALQDAQRIARVEFRYSNERVELKTLRFDAAGKLLASDLFRVQRRGHGA